MGHDVSSNQAFQLGAHGFGVPRPVLSERKARLPKQAARNACDVGLAGGAPLSEVSRRLGHESITTTVDLYGHLVPEASERARTVLGNAFTAALHLT